MTFAARWIGWIDAGDRDLFDRWVIDAATHRGLRCSWIAITHAGGAPATIGAVLLPLFWRDWPRVTSARAAAALAVSHIVVQLMKRSVSRSRPATPMIRCPDQFSFPSGHATASLAVAVSYALAFPLAGVPLMAFAVLAGWSRVMLGVHYPGDVVVGQVIALATVACVHLVR